MRTISSVNCVLSTTNITTPTHRNEAIGRAVSVNHVMNISFLTYSSNRILSTWHVYRNSQKR